MAKINNICIIGDREISSGDCVVFYPNAMSAGIIRLNIIVAHFKFESITFQNLQVIGQYLGVEIDDSYLHLREKIQVVSNFKIPRVIDDAFSLRLFPYFIRGRVGSWLNFLEPNSIATWDDLAGKN